MHYTVGRILDFKKGNMQVMVQGIHKNHSLRGVMKVNKLFKGDKVVMHDCMEAHGRENVVWECICDSYEMCGSEVVFLKGYSGAFATEFLRKVEDKN